MTETFYDVLGVAEDAPQEAITEAYREKVKEHHPDRSDDEDAGEIFKRVVRAEEVLGDEAERARYDRLGHDAYLRRVEGENVATGERSPWTPGPRNGSHDAAGARSGPGGAAGATTAAGARARSRTASRGTTTESGSGDAESSMGFGRAASRQSSAGWSGSNSSDRGVNDAAYDPDGGYAVRSWDGDVTPPNTVTVAFTQQFAIFAVALFVLYPMLLYLVTPSFSPVINLVGALAALLVLGQSLTVPKLSLVVFGAWSLLAPVGLLLVTDWGIWTEIIVLLAAWVPFAFAVVVAVFTRPG